jgi:hypothetical protein
MRIHATFLILHNGHIYPHFFNKPQTPFPSSIMLAHTQRRNQNNSSAGEEFSDVSSTDSLEDDESLAQIQDNWTFPVVAHKAKRKVYEKASKFHCRILLTRSEVVFRLLNARKSRLASFKIKSKCLHSKTLNYVQKSKGKRMLEVPVNSASRSG